MKLSYIDMDDEQHDVLVQAIRIRHTSQSFENDIEYDKRPGTRTYGTQHILRYPDAPRFCEKVGVFGPKLPKLELKREDYIKLATDLASESVIYTPKNSALWCSEYIRGGKHFRINRWGEVEGPFE